ncbi:hypothetical protein DGo_PB0395 (plasmid) [Deinococcus gobiensis I-0]|uniref:Uncharacterized protein n=1 Tax=Deinococcus gobiensis (strain DSM 21396 / JCM 16679 / CGMCC 1.7299 / I-0) TaxID=745776 RepID=H8H2B7_DEIGI|nr:hypothetical protein [Deinococcus gobiensis]AFD27664.1 hypothetical protein DGo_PB0395 [Deinococcus gobiensis I-0]
MREIIYEAGFERREVYLLPNGRFTVQVASDLLLTGGLNEPERVLALPDAEALQVLHTAAPELVVPEGLQIWQLRHPERYSLLGPEAPFPEAYRLCAVLLQIRCKVQGDMIAPTIREKREEIALGVLFPNSSGRVAHRIDGDVHIGMLTISNVAPQVALLLDLIQRKEIQAEHPSYRPILTIAPAVKRAEGGRKTEFIASLEGIEFRISEARAQSGMDGGDMFEVPGIQTAQYGRQIGGSLHRVHLKEQGLKNSIELRRLTQDLICWRTTTEGYLSASREDNSPNYWPRHMHLSLRLVSSTLQT